MEIAASRMHTAGNASVTNLLRGVDDTNVVAELYHAEHGREYGQGERAGQPLRRVA